MADETKYPWESWSPEKAAEAKRLVELLDKVKDFQSRPVGGGGKTGAADFARLQAHGLGPDAATTLSRYRTYLNTTDGGDPNWQGPLNIATGPRQAPDSKEDVDYQQRNFLALPFKEAVAFAKDAKVREKNKDNDQFYQSLVWTRPTMDFSDEPLPLKRDPADWSVFKDEKPLQQTNVSYDKAATTDESGFAKKLLDTIMNFGKSVK
jgi:hypothetical protein